MHAALFRLGAIVVVAAGAVAATAPQPARAGGIEDLVTDGVCAIVKSDGGAEAGKKIIVRVSGGRLRADGVIVSVAVWSAQQFCPDAVRKVVDVVSSAFASRRAPTVPPSAVDLAATLRRISAGAVAADLRRIGINSTTSSVQRSAGAICLKLARGEAPATVASEFAGSRRVAALGALSGVVGRTQNCKRPPQPWQTDALLASLATTLVANTYPQDLEPPIVALIAPVLHGSIADGRHEISVSWLALDQAGDVASEEAWVAVRGKWYPLTVRNSSATAWITPGEVYRFAVRARDTSGNTSGWYYSASRYA